MPTTTGVTDAVDDEIPAGTQCYARVFKTGQANATPATYAELTGKPKPL
ncbi:hypothetical protein [Achromobacter sp. Marseille-Q4954]|nr:hypothetical protein [Achromobacter sp. Marseille-Q4954]